MSIPDIEYITDLYENRAELNLLKFENHKLSVLSASISKLVNGLGEQKNLAFWPELISSLKRYRYELATTPLPFTSTVLLSDKLLSSLQTGLDSYLEFPESIAQLNLINDLIHDLPDEDHPFMKWLKAQYSDNQQKASIAICIPQTRILYEVEQSIEERNLLQGVDYEVINPRQLRKYVFYDQVIFCGSIHLFSENQYTDYEYVWRSPRAEKLYFLSFSWIRETFSPEPVFNIEPNRLPVTVKIETIPEQTGSEAIKPAPQDTETTIEDLNFSPVSFLPDTSNDKPGYHSEITDRECKAVFLDDGSFLYKDIESYSYIVRFDPETKVEKMQNTELRQGMSLIVRTEGSDDSISAVADMLLGARAVSMRQMQDDWKICFRKQVFSSEYLSDVQEELIRLGSQRANDTNIRNWIRNDTIKPNDFMDFKAIMEFSGIAEKTEAYWANAIQIFAMHIKAGKEISRLLRSRITETAINNLTRYGKVEVDLPGITGKLTVINIEAVSNNHMTIGAAHVDKLKYI